MFVTQKRSGKQTKPSKKKVKKAHEIHLQWKKSLVKVDLGSVLESELGQKWRYGALKACIG